MLYMLKVHMKTAKDPKLSNWWRMVEQGGTIGQWTYGQGWQNKIHTSDLEWLRKSTEAAGLQHNSRSCLPPPGPTLSPAWPKPGPARPMPEHESNDPHAPEKSRTKVLFTQHGVYPSRAFEALPLAHSHPASSFLEENVFGMRWPTHCWPTQRVGCFH